MLLLEIYMCFMAVCLGPQLSKPRTQNLSKEASNEACQNKINTTISEAKTRIVRTWLPKFNLFL